MLGNGRLEAMCFDGVKRLCHIRGKLRKKVWINQGDIILIGLRDYQDAKADVILKYTSDEARNLKTYGEFPETGKKTFSQWQYSFVRAQLNRVFILTAVRICMFPRFNSRNNVRVHIIPPPPSSTFDKIINHNYQKYSLNLFVFLFSTHQRHSYIRGRWL